jgi:hypothetical protein
MRAVQPNPDEKQVKDEVERYGVVNIDLAPFAGRGSVRRYFLMDECKTNATVSVSFGDE